MATPSSIEIYNQESYQLAWSLTRRYSTSFSMGIRLFDRALQPHIAAIYAVVRVADEIVDSWHELDQARELDGFETAVYAALDDQFSANPILQAFQFTAHQYQIDRKHIQAFFKSMRFDLSKTSYDQAGYEEYIYGSAEVVGLMCLSVFCEGDAELYDRLLPGARALGSAFQKVNFLRDLGADQDDLGRTYFPHIDLSAFTDTDKRAIEADIRADFAKAEKAIEQLPRSARRGVALAYAYYLELLRKIERATPAELKTKRIRVSNLHKAWLLLVSLRAY